MNELLRRRCRPLGREAAMSTEQIQNHLRRLSGWLLREGAIEKRYDFADFHRTMAFVNALAWVAHAEDHHPDLAVGYGHCVVRFNTHSAGGISINDFVCAAKVDALLPDPA
jgi:4a-hydroxytetrahydrobiopterin dehydratase